MFVVGTIVLSFCLINSLAVLHSVCNGVARYASGTSYGSVDFFNKFLTDCSALFAQF